ncbi:MAG: DEAD/DEAH box helicase [Polyangiaceae bacterium]|nr:DEAD/DEAH box helicase [Polyangiaceae bacterium]
MLDTAPQDVSKAPTAGAQRETVEALTGLCWKRFGAIDAARLAEHLARVNPDGDWRMVRASVDALARRYAFAQRDGLRIESRPPGGATLGTYSTRSATADKGARPYVTELLGVSPLRTSCSCADFVRSSLGLCKHGLAVLDALEARGKLERARATASTGASKARLSWDPMHPTRGPADRLARLSLDARRTLALGAHFDHGAPRAKELRDPGLRAALLRDLERAISRGVVEADAAIPTVLREERERSERAGASREATATAMRVLSTLKRKLYPYQREGVRRFLEQGRLLLADDMGLGKTTQAIAGCHALAGSGAIKKGLLIVPAALKPQWKREWDATTNVPLTLVEGSPSERAQLYQGTKRGFLAVGYEQLLRDFAELQAFAPDLVVLDEAQRIKNWATKSAAYVKALGPRFRLVLTGTPMENRFEELASIMDFVDDLALEPKWRLVPFHGVSVGDGSRGIGGARNLDVLRERLAPSMVRRVRKEVLEQLPARTDTVVPVAFSEGQRMPHDDLRQPIAELSAKGARRPLTQSEFLRLMQMLTTQRMLCNGLAQVNFELEWPRCIRSKPTADLLTSLQAPKLTALRELVSELVVAQGRKAVIFSQWRNMLRLSEWAVRDLLEAAGKRAAFFTGAESAKQREAAIVDFHDDPEVAVLFLSDAGGVGLNLQRAASCCINIEVPWNPAVLEQRIGRIYRLGQTLPIDVYNLVTEEGIEGRIARLVAQKKAVFTTLFDGTSDEVVFEGSSSFLEGVRKLVEPVAVPGLGQDEMPETADPEASARDEQGAIDAVRDAAGLAPTLSEPVHGPAAAMLPYSAPPPSSAQGLVIARLPDGGLRIEAPPELAGPLASLLEGLAAALRAPPP